MAKPRVSGRVPPVKAKKSAKLPGPTKNVGSDNWVKMAGSIEQALDRMRTMYELLVHLKDFHTGFGCECASNPKNWEPLLNETAAVANILKAGLKARVYNDRRRPLIVE